MENLTEQTIRYAYKMDKDELESLIRRLREIYINKQRNESRRGVLSYDAGDTVVFTGRNRRLPFGTNGTVHKVKVTRILVDFGMFGKWNVYPNHIEKKGN